MTRLIRIAVLAFIAGCTLAACGRRATPMSIEECLAATARRDTVWSDAGTIFAIVTACPVPH